MGSVLGVGVGIRQNFSGFDVRVDLFCLGWVSGFWIVCGFAFAFCLADSGIRQFWCFVWWFVILGLDYGVGVV